jgi:TRAP transporter 4TM/12TM fusion protein
VSPIHSEEVCGAGSKMKIEKLTGFFKRREGRKGIDWEMIKEETGENAIVGFLKKKGLSPHRILAFFIGSLTLSMVIILLFNGTFGAMETRIFRSTILSFFLVLAFLLYPLGRKSWKDPFNAFFVIDVLLIFLTIAIQCYTYINIDRFTWKIGILSSIEKTCGIVEFFLILEASRRSMGLVFTGTCFFFMIEPFFSNYLPGSLRGPVIDFEHMVEQQFMRDDGVFGIALGVMVSTLSIFLIFGSVLEKTSTGQFIIALAFAIAGKYRGGPAKVSVFSSSLFGTMSGSAVANVVVDGVVTIPMMKQVGYSKEYAGAIEAATSSGGQIMPPVMGVAAFLIAGILGVSYATICKHAVIPALLYYLALYFAIDLNAKKRDLKPLNEAELPHLVNVVRDGGYLFLPVVAIIYFLIEGFTPEKAVIFSLVIIFVLSFIRPQSRLTPVKLLDALEEGGKTMVAIGVSCAAVGLIIGSLGASGLGTKFTSLVLDVSGGYLWLALIFTMIAALILGMGVPTSVVYILLAVLVIPALVQMGVMPIAAHLFAFYFGVIANITPPVAMASFAAAAIAKSDYMKTGFTSMRIAIPTYLIPFVFIYAPGLLLMGSISGIILVVFTTSIGVWALAAANEGWLFRRMNALERIVLTIAAIALIIPKWYTDIVGLLLFGFFIFVQRKQIGLFNRSKKGEVKQ